jgi:hypothetical protein
LYDLCAAINVFALETMLALGFSLPALLDSATYSPHNSAHSASGALSASVALEQHASLRNPNVIQKGKGLGCIGLTSLRMRVPKLGVEF